MIPDASASPGSALAWYLLHHWGTGPGTVAHEATTPGWHSYADLGLALVDRLQVASAVEQHDLVVVVFVQRARRLVAVVEPDTHRSHAEHLGSLWTAIAPLLESDADWAAGTARVGESTYLLTAVLGSTDD